MSGHDAATVIRRAATIICSRSAHATTQTRWRCGREVGRTIYQALTGGHLIGTLDHRQDAAWATLMHPRGGPLLAALLFQIADRYDSAPYEAALAYAHEIIAAVETETG